MENGSLSNMETLMLDEDQYFALKAYIQSPGPQTIVLQGYLTKQKGGKTYVVPLLPRMFYGVDGNQLGATWRQNFTSAGEQVILSRSGGQPKVGEPDVYWRKLGEKEPEKVPASKPTSKIAQGVDQFVSWLNSLTPYEKLLWAVSGITVVGTIGFIIYARRKAK